MKKKGDKKMAKDKGIPQILTKKIQRLGGSKALLIPDKWLTQHNLDVGDDITLIMNSGLKILTPEQAKEWYKTLHKKVQESVDWEEK